MSMLKNTIKKVLLTNPGVKLSYANIFMKIYPESSDYTKYQTIEERCTELYASGEIYLSNGKFYKLL